MSEIDLQTNTINILLLLFVLIVTKFYILFYRGRIFSMLGGKRHSFWTQILNPPPFNVRQIYSWINNIIFSVLFGFISIYRGLIFADTRLKKSQPFQTHSSNRSPPPSLPAVVEWLCSPCVTGHNRTAFCLLCSFRKQWVSQCWMWIFAYIGNKVICSTFVNIFWNIQSICMHWFAPESYVFWARLTVQNFTYW